MTRPLSPLTTYVLATDEYQTAEKALSLAHERRNRALCAHQDAWREVRKAQYTPGIHSVGNGRAVRISGGDYPPIEALFAGPADTF